MFSENSYPIHFQQRNVLSGNSERHKCVDEREIKSAIWNVQINGCDIYVNKGQIVLKSVTQVQTKPDVPSLLTR